LAIDNYEKSLELNSANDNAKEKLEVLETVPARSRSIDSEPPEEVTDPSLGSRPQLLKHKQ